MILNPGDKCLFVESTEKYPEQQLTEGVIVSYEPPRFNELGSGDYVVRVSTGKKTEWRHISEARIFGIADRKHAEEEARRLNSIATVKEK